MAVFVAETEMRDMGCGTMHSGKILLLRQPPTASQCTAIEIKRQNRRDSRRSAIILEPYFSETFFVYRYHRVSTLPVLPPRFCQTILRKLCAACRSFEIKEYSDSECIEMDNNFIGPFTSYNECKLLKSMGPTAYVRNIQVYAGTYLRWSCTSTNEVIDSIN